MKSIFLSAIAFVALLAGTTVKAQTADEIIQKHINAIGGLDNWKKINSMKMTGSVNANGAEISITGTVENGKGARQDWSVMGMTGYSIITPTAGWVYNPGTGQTKADAIPDDMVKQSQDELDIQGPLIDYKTKGNTVEYLGKDDVDGTECYKLKVTFKNGKEETMYIDASNYYHIRSVEKVKANGKEEESVTNYSNYQKLPEGIYFPMTVGSGQGEVTFKTVEINKPIDESIFKPAN